MMNRPKKYVVSRTLDTPIWRDTTIIRDDVVNAVRALKEQSGGDILTDGSSQLVHTLLENDLVDELHVLLYPVTLGKGKRLWSDNAHTAFTLRSTRSYPTGVVGLDYVRQR
jgi:dihydrofolate reductase